MITSTREPVSRVNHVVNPSGGMSALMICPVKVHMMMNTKKKIAIAMRPSRNLPSCQRLVKA